MENSVTNYYEPGSSFFTELSKEELENKLFDFIRELLENDFDRLRLLIYRHDVDERKFNIALRLPGKDSQAWKITHLVIEREMQKIETRMAYKRSKQNNKKQIED